MSEHSDMSTEHFKNINQIPQIVLVEVYQPVGKKQFLGKSIFQNRIHRRST